MALFLGLSLDWSSLLGLVGGAITALFFFFNLYATNLQQNVQLEIITKEVKEVQVKTSGIERSLARIEGKLNLGRTEVGSTK